MRTVLRALLVALASVLLAALAWPLLIGYGAVRGVGPPLWVLAGGAAVTALLVGRALALYEYRQGKSLERRHVRQLEFTSALPLRL